MKKVNKLLKSFIVMVMNDRSIAQMFFICLKYSKAFIYNLQMPCPQTKGHRVSHSINSMNCTLYYKHVQNWNYASFSHNVLRKWPYYSSFSFIFTFYAYMFFFLLHIFLLGPKYALLFSFIYLCICCLLSNLYKYYSSFQYYLTCINFHLFFRPLSFSNSFLLLWSFSL